jgi:hypothetical protein
MHYPAELQATYRERLRRPPRMFTLCSARPECQPLVECDAHINEVKGINRAVYDVNVKDQPSGTIGKAASRGLQGQQIDVSLLRPFFIGTGRRCLIVATRSS